jgi:hypothetical protein
MLRNSAHRKEILQCQYDLSGRKRAGHLQGQALSRKLVDNDEYLQLAAILSAIDQKIIAPHMVRIPRAVAHAAIGAVSGQTTPFPLFSRHLEVLLLPETVNAFEVNA